MSKIVEEVEASNLNYADDFGSKKDLNLNQPEGLLF